MSLESVLFKSWFSGSLSPGECLRSSQWVLACISQRAGQQAPLAGPVLVNPASLLASELVGSPGSTPSTNTRVPNLASVVSDTEIRVWWCKPLDFVVHGEVTIVSSHGDASLEIHKQEDKESWGGLSRRYWTEETKFLP